MLHAVFSHAPWYAPVLLRLNTDLLRQFLFRFPRSIDQQVLQMKGHFFITVSLLMAATSGLLHGAAMDSSTESSAFGLVAAGVLLIGIGRVRRRKR